MRPPTFRTRVTGHPIFCLVTYGFLALAVYGWMTGKDTPFPILILAALMASAAAKARAAIRQHSAFEREWAGIQQGSTRRRRPSATWWLAIVCIGSLLWAMRYPKNDHSDSGSLAAAMFVISAAGLALRMLYSLLIALGRWMRNRKQAANSAVRLCLPVPRNAPSVEQATAALPSYCKELLLRSSP